MNIVFDMNRMENAFMNFGRSHQDHAGVGMSGKKGIFDKTKPIWIFQKQDTSGSCRTPYVQESRWSKSDSWKNKAILCKPLNGSTSYHAMSRNAQPTFAKDGRQGRSAGIRPRSEAIRPNPTESD